MNTEFIVSLIGADRTGLIKQLIQKTHDLKGQWLSSKFSTLEGRFAALIKLSVPERHEQQLKDFFCSQDELTAQFNPAKETLSSHETTLKLNIEASDRFGLINEITDRLLSLGIIITHMKCNRIAVIDIGGSLLSTDITLNLPAETQPQEVINKLEKLADHAVITIIE